MEKPSEEMKTELKTMLKESFDDFMAKENKEEQFAMYARFVVGTTCFDNIIAFVQNTNGVDDLMAKKDKLMTCVLTEVNKHMVAGLSLGYTVEKNAEDK
jgi:hypothetical protein